MDFAIQIFGGIRITDRITILITETTVSTWIVMGILIALAIIVRVKSKNWDPAKKPTGVQNFVEWCIETWEKFFRSNASEKVMNFSPWFFTLFIFVLTANMIGVVGIRPPTADWGMTFALAFSSFVLFQYAGISRRPKAYLKGIFLEPVFVFAPLNLIGELSRPIAMSFRLFGNVLGGMILLSLLYGIAPFILRFIFPVALHLYFDLAAGALQAIIFTVLSLTFIGLAAED